MIMVLYLLFSLNVCDVLVFVSSSPFICRCLSLHFIPVRLVLALQALLKLT